LVVFVHSFIDDCFVDVEVGGFVGVVVDEEIGVVFVVFADAGCTWDDTSAP
jgi:hypothetical protein